MKTASLVINFKKEKEGALRDALSCFDNLEIFAVKDERMVIVIEAENIVQIEDMIDKISSYPMVENILPVYISNL